jgi:phosphoribosylformylglycinamidine synthase
MKEVITHSKKGGLVMGICNGFQVLVESGLLPGVLIRNINLKFICKNITVKVTNNNTNFTSKAKRNSVLEIPIAHNEGNYFASKDLISELEDNNQIVLQYCDATGNINDQSNPNGSIKNIAGIVNKKANVFGLMPHPERASESILGGIDGSLIFKSLK